MSPVASPASRPRSPWVALAGFSAAYLALAELGRLLTVGTSSFSTFWPPSGLFLAALLVAPRSRWPLVVAAAFVPSSISNLAHGSSPGMAVGFFAANALESLVAALFVLRLTSGRRPSMASVPDVLALVLGGAVVGTALAASAGASLLGTAGAPFRDTWVLWWSGSALGVLVVASPALAFLDGEPSAPWTRRRLLEAALLTAAIALGGLAMASSPAAFFAREYVLIPPVVWAAIRFGPRGATVAGAAVAVIVVAVTQLGQGHLATQGADVLGAVRFFLGLVLTTALLVAAAVEARRREELARRLVEVAMERASDAVAVVEGATGRVRWANAALAGLLGRTRSELVDQPIWTLQRAGRPAWDALLASLRTGPSPFVREEAVPRAGGVASMELAASRVELDGREHVVVALRDIGDRRQAEAAMRLASIGSLAAGVAHEINNPLAFVLGNVSMAREALLKEPARTPLLEELDLALADAEEGAIRVRDIVRDLKLFARPAEGAGPSDARKSMRAALSLARNELRHRARVETSLDEEVPLVAGNEGRLAQVFLNLLVNAAQAIPEGHLEANLIRAVVRPGPDGTVVAEVSDSGAGMSPEVKARVFEPFFTTKEKGRGTGLGLAMVYGFAKQSAGHVGVYSEPGHGTTIKLYLPRAQGARPAPVDPKAQEPAIRGGTESVLVVEDDEPVRQLACLELRALGYRVLEAPNGTDALRIVESEEPIELLFTDVVMPGGMSGRQLADAARRLRPGLRVLYTSGYTENAIVHHGRLDPGVMLLPKPYRRADLARAIRTALSP